MITVLVPRTHAAECSAKFAGKSMATVHVGDQQIDVIGWDHLEQENVERIIKASRAARARARRDDCRGAQRILRTIIAREADSVGKQGFVVRALEGLNRSRPVDQVAREISPDEWVGLKSKLEARAASLAGLAGQCKNLGREAKAVIGVALGPELSFVKRHQTGDRRPSLLPVESYALRMKNAEDFHSEVVYDFDDEHSKYANRPGWRELQDALFAQRPPPEDAIRSLAAHSGSNVNEAERTLRSDLAVWQRRVSGAYLRDEHIASSLRTAPGHTVVVIGQRHVRDLVERLQRPCAPGLSPAPSTYEASAVSSAR